MVIFWVPKICTSGEYPESYAAGKGIWDLPLETHPTPDPGIVSTWDVGAWSEEEVGFWGFGVSGSNHEHAFARARVYIYIYPPGGVPWTHIWDPGYPASRLESYAAA